MKRITEDLRKYAAEQATSEEETRAERHGGEVEGFEPPGGEREDFCAAKGHRPRLRAQPSQFVEKGAEVYVKA